MITLEEKVKSNVNSMTEKKKKISDYGNGMLIPLFSKTIPIHSFTSLGYFTTLKGYKWEADPDLKRNVIIGQGSCSTTVRASLFKLPLISFFFNK